MAIHVTPIPKLTSYVTSANTFGTTGTAGSSNTSIRSDAALAVFNADVPDAITFSQAGGTGAVNFASRIDHLHAMAATPGSILCRVYNNTDQSVASATATKLAMNAEQLDTDTMHDPTTNNSRITINTAGQYLCGINIQGDEGSSGHQKNYILLNNSTIIANVETQSIGGGWGRQNVITLYDFDVDDYIEAVSYQNTGSTVTVTYSAYASPIFWAVMVA